MSCALVTAGTADFSGFSGELFGFSDTDTSNMLGMSKPLSRSRSTNWIALGSVVRSIAAKLKAAHDKNLCPANVAENAAPLLFPAALDRTGKLDEEGGPAAGGDGDRAGIAGQRGAKVPGNANEFQSSRPWEAAPGELHIAPPLSGSPGSHESNQWLAMRRSDELGPFHVTGQP
jgi:hypothetical protein